MESKDVNSEIVNATFSFRPLSTASTKDDVDVIIGFGENATLSKLNKIAGDADIKMTSLNGSLKLGKVKPKSVPSLKLFAVLLDADNQIETIGYSENYKKALDGAPFIQIECDVSGLLDNKNQVNAGWLYWFPSDRFLLNLPLEMKSSTAILSELEIQKIPKLRNRIDLAGVEAELQSDHEKYSLKRTDSNRRFVLYPDTSIETTGIFKRHWFSSLFLTTGQVLLAGFSGFVLGCVASMSSSPLDKIIQSLGILGLPVWMWGTVVNRHNLPSVAFGEPTTLFELFFVVSWLIFAVSALLTWKKRGRLSIIIATVATIASLPIMWLAHPY